MPQSSGVSRPASAALASRAGWIVHRGLFAAFFLCAPAALANGETSCLEKARQEYASAIAIDDAAYKRAVAGCQQTWSKPSQVQDLLACTTKAAANHEKNADAILKTYEEARRVCYNKIGQCKLAAWQEYQKEYSRLMMKQLADLNNCARLFGQTGSRYTECRQAATDQYKADVAAADRKKAAAEKQCDQIATIARDSRRLPVAS